MADKLYIYPVNETYVQLDGDRNVLLDIYNYMTFDAPDAEWSYAYQNKMWDGKVRLLDNNTFKIYKGLVHYIETFALQQQWEVEKDPALFVDNGPFDAVAYMTSLKLQLKGGALPHDFQYLAVQKAIDDDRHTFESATGSGKSLMIYCLARYYMKKFDLNKKILVTEPTKGLVQQMLTDWQSYAPHFPIEKLTHQIYDGAGHNTNKPIVLSTWQAMMDEKEGYIKQFGAIIVDECHGAQAPELKGILERSPDCKYRFGFTGTLDETETNRLVIEGLTGPALVISRTFELIERGILPELRIKSLITKYPESVCKENHKRMTAPDKKERMKSFSKEKDFIVNYAPRNQYIANLVASIKDKENILILTEYHDKKPHCDIIKRFIEATCPHKKIVLVTGDTDEDPQELREFVDGNDDVVIIATFGKFATGRSINNIQHIIFATYGKGMIKVLQSLGRGLRKDGKEDKVTAYDIVDDLSYKNHKNYLLKHALERIRIYVKQQLKYKIITVQLTD
jgi:superfamily II DNA or RNA helicase